MVRTVSDNEITELPADEDLWAAIKDQLDPKLPGGATYFLTNLMRHKPFGTAITDCLARPAAATLPETELLEHVRELQRLRMCIKAALGKDVVAITERKVPDYPPHLAAALDKLENCIWTERMRIHYRAEDISDECDTEICEIENFEPIDWPLWLPWRRPEEDSAPS